ncbi:MAG: helix-turn-helix domain-containing protein [Bacteroidales bacterium]|nr:helix-turn-helix domain-containing protein [Bacteroidales bacterium]
MSEHDAITFDNLPEAVQHLLQEIAYIKNHLLNKAATTATPASPETEKELLTVEDVSKMLNISKGAIYNMTSARQIPFFRRGGRIYFDRVEIDEWIRSDRRKTIKQLQDEAELDLKKNKNKY